MMRHLASLALIWLTACAAPAPEPFKTRGSSDDSSALAEPMVEEAPVAAAPVSPAEICGDSGDGIGGTGCPVE